MHRLDSWSEAINGALAITALIGLIIYALPDDGSLNMKFKAGCFRVFEIYEPEVPVYEVREPEFLRIKDSLPEDTIIKVYEMCL